MLQAAVHSMYSRLGSGADVRDRAPAAASSGASGSFSGQSPQNGEPPLIQVRAQAVRRPVRCQMSVSDVVRMSPSTRLRVRIRAAADDAAVAEHDGDRPRPGAGEAGGEVVQGHLRS